MVINYHHEKHFSKILQKLLVLFINEKLIKFCLSNICLHFVVVGIKKLSYFLLLRRKRKLYALFFAFKQNNKKRNTYK